jgi:hypothetical protein
LDWLLTLLGHQREYRLRTAACHKSVKVKDTALEGSIRNCTQNCKYESDIRSAGQEQYSFK